MEAHQRTRFDARGIVVGDRSIPFYAGAMHYWRVPEKQWRTCLRAMHELGLTLVETYIPWRVHEPERGRFDLREVPRFIAAARAEGLHVVVRPGPHVNAELTSFGMPDWVLAEPACQAKTSRGTPAWFPSPPRAWPIPSYASETFRAHVRTWYAAVAQALAPELDGVAAIGVDNEAQMFFRLGAFDLDYHPDAITWWREASGLDGDPPRDASDPARAALWVRFKDDYLARALGEFATMLDEVGLGGIAKFHNLPPGHHGLYDLRKIQTAIGGPVGIDAYTPRADFPALRHRALACVGNALIPIGFEVGVGFFPWFPPLDTAKDDPTRERDHLLTLLAAGVRGFNLFMAVERDRYYGAAIDQHGRVEAKWVKPLLDTLHEVDWPSLRRTPAVALVDCKADARFGIATCAIDPMTPVLADVLGLGPAGAAELGTDDGAALARKWQTAVARALELAQVPYVIVDEATPEDELATYRAVIAPTGDRIDRGLFQRLRSLVDHKRAVVVIGPGTPSRDELDQPLLEPMPKRLGRLREGSLDDLAGLAADLAQLVPQDDAWQVERPDDVRAAFFGKLVFLSNDSPRATTAVLLADAASLRDPFTNEHLRVTGGKVSIAMPPLGVRMFVVA